MRKAARPKRETPQQRYLASDKGKAAAKAARDRYLKSPKGRAAHRAASNRHHQKNRRLCLEHYSDGQGKPPRCMCPGCTETHIEFLTIDHIKGGGGRHRKEIGNGSNTYKWLKRKRWPKGFRTLCYNCNNSYAHYCRCPHNSLPATPRRRKVSIK